MKNKLLSILILISLSSQAQLSPSLVLRVQDTTTVFNQNVPMGSVIYDNTLKKYWGVVLSQASTRKLSQCVVNTDIKELTNPVNPTLSNKFIVQGTTDAGLTGAQFLGALGTGIVKNTTSTGVLSIATGADLPAMSATVGGAVPTPPNVATKYLDGTGAWSTPNGGSGTVTSITMGDGLASTQSPLTTSGTMKVDTSQTMILSRQRAANTYALKGSVSGPSNHRQVYNASPIYLPFIGTTYSYLGPFTITYIPAGNHALIMFSATVGVSAISQTGSIALYVGSVTPTYVQSMYFNLYAGYAPMSFQTLQSVTAGTSTTYSIYWYGSSTGNSINYGTFTIIDLP